MTTRKKIAFIFPGQGSQYPGMGKDFYDNFDIAKKTFQEADDILQRDVTSIIFNGPEETLTETRNSQTGIYVTSLAILNVLRSLYPEIQPSACAGLSLGEYTAVTASNRLTIDKGLPLVQYRGQFMNDACTKHPGTMAVIIGLDRSSVEEALYELRLPNDIWIANVNCPGQIVISGTNKGIEAASHLIKAKGAKKIVPLQVHGAFHSGLMKDAEDRIKDFVMTTLFSESNVELAMNVTGGLIKTLSEVRENLIKQITHPVEWEKCILTIQNLGIDLWIEIGCGKTLAGMNKRIGTIAPTISVEKIGDLSTLEAFLKNFS